MRTAISKAQMDRIRHRLLHEKNALVARMDSEPAAPNADELWGTDELGLSAALTAEREKALRLRQKARSLVDRIDEALHRLENGSYGVCKRCGKPIDPARLEALPYTVVCIDDARRARAS